MIPTLTIASEKICFDNVSSAKKLVVDLQYKNDQIKYFESKYNFCDADRTNLKAQRAVLETETVILRQDISVLKEVAEDYKKQYLATNEQLQDSKQSKPSRMTWFGAGVVSALVATLTVIFVVR